MAESVTNILSKASMKQRPANPFTVDDVLGIIDRPKGGGGGGGSGGGGGGGGKDNSRKQDARLPGLKDAQPLRNKKATGQRLDSRGPGRTASD